MEHQIRALLKQGIYHQDEIFNRLYPTFKGHYSRLRDMISKEKNNA